MDSKVCMHCDIELPLYKFRVKKQKGRPYLLGYCHECEKQRSRDYQRNRYIPHPKKTVHEPDIDGKTCTYCEQKKPLDNFRQRKQKGKVITVARCKKCEQKINAQQRDPEKRRVAARKRRSIPEVKQRLKESHQKWLSKNPERYKDMQKKSIKKQVDNLTDQYVKRSITKSAKDDIPNELIELKRVNILLKREIKKITRDGKHD